MSKSIIKIISVMAVALAAAMTACNNTQQPENYLFRSGTYTVYHDSIVDGNYSAKILNNGTIISNFNRIDSVEVPETVKFRFAINGEDTEMLPIHWHEQNISENDSSIIHQFGVITKASSSKKNKHAQNPGSIKVRLYMRPILRQLKDSGYYVTRLNDTIYQANFKGVWLTGNTPPLHSDVKRLHSQSHLQLNDRGDSIYEISVEFNKLKYPNYFTEIASADTLPHSSPVFISRIGIFDACYNIASSRIDSLGTLLLKHGYQLNTIEVSKGIILSSGVLSNDIAKALLKKCVERGRIHQDGGEGGGWPIVSDRLIWVVAAHEVFKNSGDTTWLKYSYNVACKTLADVRHVQLSPDNQLLQGASWAGKSFIRSYPYWTTSSDMFESQSLLPNVIYYNALICMSKMAEVLNKSEENNEYLNAAQDVSKSINQLFWIPNLQRYSEFLYGSLFPLQSHSTDNLGQALAILTGPATPEMSRAILKMANVSDYGIQRTIPSVSSASQWEYTGNLIDSSTLAFWAWACSKTGNLKGLTLSLASLYRAAMLSSFTGAKINAENGKLVYESINRITNQFLMNASIVGATVRNFIGYENIDGGFRFSPSIPNEFKGTYQLSSFKRRESEWNITVKGSGNVVVSITVDGLPVHDTFISDTVRGNHSLIVNLSGETTNEQSINNSASTVLPETPVILWRQKHALVENFNPGFSYFTLINGVIQDQISRDTYSFHALPNCCVLQFQPFLNNRILGFASRPKLIVKNSNIVTVPAYMLGKTGTNLPVMENHEDNYIELSPARNKSLQFKIESKNKGRYFLVARFANGSGEENTQTRCVIRTVSVNNKRVGTLILQCNGEGNWVKFISSNKILFTLEKGLNNISIDFVSPYDLNSAGSAGTALIEWIKLIRID